MRKALFEGLKQSIREAGAIRRGELAPGAVFTVSAPDVLAIREKYGLSQAEFAAAFGINLKTLQNWEQGRRKPEGPALVLLNVAARHPEAVLDVVQKTAKGKWAAGSLAAPRATPALSGIRLAAKRTASVKGRAAKKS
jgi:putative transcriptional regulator